MTKSVRLAWQRALLPVVIAGATLFGAAKLSAQISSSKNSNAPVNYAADRIEMQDRDNRVVLTGDVDITQADLRLRAARVTVNYTNNGSLKIQRMIANGNVYVTRGDQSARGDAAVYDLVQRVITMAGNVALNRNGDVLNGGRLVMNLDTGMSSVDGRSSGTGTGAGAGAGKGGRVSGTFTVDTKNTGGTSASSGGKTPTAAPSPSATKGK
jgi:lipopolysaccharide export system protein LptA